MPTRMVGPKARFSRRRTPKMSVKPRASSEYVAPSITPSTRACRKSTTSRSASLDAEVRPADPLVRRDFGRGAVKGDAPLLEEVRVVGDGEREPRVLLDQEHRDAFAVQPLDDLEDLLHDEWREPQRRLVHHEQAGAGHQRARHCQHLLLAARK